MSYKENSIIIVDVCTVYDHFFFKEGIEHVKKETEKLHNIE